MGGRSPDVTNVKMEMGKNLSVFGGQKNMRKTGQDNLTKTAPRSK